jgi:iron complex outermembrane receptor protein
MSAPRSVSVRFSPVAVAVTAILTGPSVALAQESSSADAETNLAEVVVTGTRAKDRTTLDSPLPVDVLSAEDIQATGAIAGELGQALQSLVPSFNFPRQSNSGGADHVRAAQLRGMSPDQVLVLVNGKRRHTSALVNLESKTGKGTTPVDFNAIPLNSIKRVEVLRDGAGAQYGSDAIAGVVNVILDDSTEGGEFSLSFGEHFTDFDPIDDSISDGRTITADVRAGFGVGDGGFFSVGAEFRDREETNRAGFGVLPFFEEQTPRNFATESTRNFRPGDGEARDVAIWYNSEIPLGDTSSIYTFGTYSERDSTGATFFRFPDSSQNVLAIYPSGFRPVSLGDNSNLSLAGGWTGDVGAWTLDASVTLGQNDFNYRLRNSLNASLGAASPTSFKIGDYKFSQWVANFDLSRPLSAGDNAWNLALGAEYRRETFETEPGDPASYALGPINTNAAGAQAGPGLSPADAVDESRNVTSVYAGLSSDVTDALFVEFAARFEDYSDFGNALAGKASALWKITPAFALRGALSNSFRAPSLSQVSFRSTTTGFGDGGSLSQILTLPVSDPIARALGAEELDAEESVNASLGITYALTNNFNLTLDAYQIDVDDRITVSERISGDEVTAFIQSRFAVAGISGVNFFTNAVDTKTRGIDLVMTAQQQAGAGELRLTYAFSYAKTEVESVRATPAQLLALGVDNVIFGVEERNTLEDAAPRTKSVLSVDWSSDRWSWLLRGTQYGSAVRVFNFGGGFEPTQRYRGKFQLDLEAAYKPTDKISVSIGAVNALDEYPDRSIDDISYFGNFPYDVVSPIGFNGRFVYLRSRIAF